MVGLHVLGYWRRARDSNPLKSHAGRVRQRPPLVTGPGDSCSFGEGWPPPSVGAATSVATKEAGPPAAHHPWRMVTLPRSAGPTPILRPYQSLIGFRLRDLQPVEELRRCPLGPEHVKGHVLPMLRDDLVFALGL